MVLSCPSIEGQVFISHPPIGGWGLRAVGAWVGLGCPVCVPARPLAASGSKKDAGTCWRCMVPSDGVACAVPVKGLRGNPYWLLPYSMWWNPAREGSTRGRG